MDKRYQVRHVLGNGAYGVVFSVKDTQTGEKLAVKKMEKTFDHTTLTKRTLRELKIMRLLSHDNILRLRTIQLPMNYESLDEIYVVMDKMETDLSEVIKSPQELKDEH
jgi:serine/threonine protein kinase